MGLRTIFKTAGHWLKGSIVKVDSEIQFDTTTNPEIDSTGGGFVWKTITNVLSSWKLRDDTAGEDIIALNTRTAVKTLTIHPNYQLVILNQLSGNIITPPTLTASVDNYSPTGFADSVLIRQDIDLNNREITGFVAPPANQNRVIAVNNISTLGFDLRFGHNDAGSIAANRLLMRDDGNRSLKPNETAIFYYDHVQSRWKPYNRIG